MPSFLTEKGSEAFSEFLDLLGEEVALEGWQHFRGGLDVKSTYSLSFSTLYRDNCRVFPSRLTCVVVGFDNYGGLTLIKQSLRLGNGSVSPG